MRLPPELHGLRFDLALSRLVPNYSRSLLVQWIKQKYISVNGKFIQPKDKIMGGDVIAFLVEPEDLKIPVLQALAEPIPLEVVYEDEELLVINKPAGLVVHPGAGVSDGTLVNALLHHDKSLVGLPRAGIVHRLDKDTTGLLVVAKTLEVHTLLIRQMQERKINREYIALVCGNLPGKGEINTYYGRHPINRLKMAVTKSGKQAITQYSVNRHFPNFTLMNVKLHTGRTHQIRVHMAFINHPIVGDPLYGRKLMLPADTAPNLVEAVKHFKRQALHAAMLSFSHPISQKLLTFQVDIPQDFDYLLSVL